MLPKNHAVLHSAYVNYVNSLPDHNRRRAERFNPRIRRVETSRRPCRRQTATVLWRKSKGGAWVDRIPRFRIFAATGYGFLAVSYRGNGGSVGSPTQLGLMEMKKLPTEKPGREAMRAIALF